MKQKEGLQKNDVDCSEGTVSVKKPEGLWTSNKNCSESCDKDCKRARIILKKQ